MEVRSMSRMGLLVIGAVILGMVMGVIGIHNYSPTGTGPPTAETGIAEIARWGPLKMSGITNNYANIIGAVLRWNSTGTYITVVVRVDKPCVIEGIYRTDGFVAYNYQLEHDYDYIARHGTLLLKLGKWYKPGVYNFTIPVGRGKIPIEYYADAYENPVDKTWYMLIPVPTTELMDVFDTYKYRITSVKPVNETAYVVMTGMKLVTPYSDKYFTTLVIRKSGDGWYWSRYGESGKLGWIREGARILNPYIPANISMQTSINETIKEEESIIEKTLEMYRNGLNVTPDQVLKVWNRGEKLIPIRNAMFVVAYGDCTPNKCWVKPVVRYDVMRKIVTGELPLTVTGYVEKLQIIGEGKVGEETVYLARKMVYLVTVTRDKTGISRDVRLVRNETIAVLGPKPTGYTSLAKIDVLFWGRVAILVDVAPNHMAGVSTYPLIPNLPAPSEKVSP
jgi:hypothetical protein